MVLLSLISLSAVAQRSNAFKFGFGMDYNPNIERGVNLTRIDVGAEFLHFEFAMGPSGWRRFEHTMWSKAGGGFEIPITPNFHLIAKAGAIWKEQRDKRPQTRMYCGGDLILLTGAFIYLDMGITNTLYNGCKLGYTFSIGFYLPKIQL